MWQDLAARYSGCIVMYNNCNVFMEIISGHFFCGNCDCMRYAGHDSDCFIYIENFNLNSSG